MLLPLLMNLPSPPAASSDNSAPPLQLLPMTGAGISWFVIPLAGILYLLLR